MFDLFDLFIHFLYFFFNWRVVNPSLTYDDLYRKSYFWLYLTKKDNPTSWIISSKITKKLSLIEVGFFNFLTLFTETLIKFWKANKNWFKIFNLVIVTSNKVYFMAYVKALNVLWISTEDQTYHTFSPFTGWDCMG